MDALVAIGSSDSIAARCEWGPTGLGIPDNISWDEWVSLGFLLARLHGAIQWLAGDWWIWGERHYGERAAAASSLGIDPGTLSQYAWVAGRVKPYTRVQGLSWTYHREIAPLSDEEQGEWLSKALPEPGRDKPAMTVRELHRELHPEEPAELTAIPIPSLLRPGRSFAERRAWFVYEAARLAATAAHAPIVPEPWESRDEAFRQQMIPVIDRQCGPDRKSSPEELHDDWVRSYEVMGWVYGPERDPEQRTHPDIVPYGDLDPLERDKDEVFVALCEIARQWVREEAAS